MRSVNVALCFVVGALLLVGLLETGLRVIGLGPVASVTHFDPVTGWSNAPNAVGRVHKSEFDVRIETNALGLRDDPMDGPAKPPRTFRVLALGDSFTLGYTVDRRDLFVDQLESWWRAEGRAVDVVNAGTEGWSTDQEVAWFETRGAAFAPDVVVLFAFENDLYWCGQTHYTRFQKPRYTSFGNREKLVLTDPGEKPWFERTAIGQTWSVWTSPRLTWEPVAGHPVSMESAAYFLDPPSFQVDAVARARGALTALKHACDSIGARLVLVPIPGKEAVDPAARRALAGRLNVPPGTWSPDEPVETFLRMGRELNVECHDPREEFRGAIAAGRRLYYDADFHLNPEGNRALTRFVHDAFERGGAFPAAFARTREVDLPLESRGWRPPTWSLWYAGLWAVLAVVFARTYPKEPWWKAVFGVAAMLALVFGIALGGSALLRLLPARYATAATIVFVTVVLTFVAYKLRTRFGTITELLGAFTRRGHWYLMPLVVVLLTVGSLLVIAATSPLIAPFIYTLF